MAYPAIRANANNISAVSAANQTLTIPGTVQAGDLGLVFMYSRKPWASVITEPAGWTPIVTQTHVGTGSTVAVYSRTFVAGDANPVWSFNDTTQRQVLAALWLSGASGIGVIGTQATETTTDTTDVSNALTTSSTENLIVDFHGWRNEPTNPPTSGSATPDAAQAVFAVCASGSQPGIWVGSFQKATGGATNAQTLTTDIQRLDKWGQQFAILPVQPQQVWRPTADGDGTYANWTKQPPSANTAADCVNDSNPATYLQSADNPSSQVYSTQTFTLSVPADLSTLRVQVNGYLAAGSSGSRIIALLQGATVIKSMTVNPLAGTDTASVLTLTQAEAQTITVTSNQWQNLRVRVTDTAAA